MNRVILDVPVEVVMMLEASKICQLRPGVGRRAIFLGGHVLFEKVFWCQDCKTTAHGLTNFMVENTLWRSQHLTGIICWQCFEERIGRQLEEEDLKDVPSNVHMLKVIQTRRQTGYPCLGRSTYGRRPGSVLRTRPCTHCPAAKYGLLDSGRGIGPKPHHIP